MVLDGVKVYTKWCSNKSLSIQVSLLRIGTSPPHNSENTRGPGDGNLAATTTLQIPPNSIQELRDLLFVLPTQRQNYAKNLQHLIGKL